jgi:hypothetical protein
MASIRAVTEAIAGEAARLNALAPELQMAAGVVGTTQDAAADTEASGDCADFVRAVATALGGFAAAEAALGNAVALAAECYTLADELSIPESATG